MQPYGVAQCEGQSSNGMQAIIPTAKYTVVRTLQVHVIFEMVRDSLKNTKGINACQHRTILLTWLLVRYRTLKVLMDAEIKMGIGDKFQDYQCANIRLTTVHCNQTMSQGGPFSRLPCAMSSGWTTTARDSMFDRF